MKKLLIQVLSITLLLTLGVVSAVTYTKLISAVADESNSANKLFTKNTITGENISQSNIIIPVNKATATKNSVPSRKDTNITYPCIGGTANPQYTNETAIDNCAAMQRYYDDSYAELQLEWQVASGSNNESLNETLKDLNELYEPTGITLKNSDDDKFADHYTFYQQYGDNLDDQWYRDKSLAAYKQQLLLQLENMNSELGQYDLYSTVLQKFQDRYDIVNASMGQGYPWTRSDTWFVDCNTYFASQTDAKSYAELSPTDYDDRCGELWVNIALSSSNSNDFYTASSSSSNTKATDAQAKQNANNIMTQVASLSSYIYSSALSVSADSQMVYNLIEAEDLQTQMSQAGFDVTTLDDNDFQILENINYDTSSLLDAKNLASMDLGSVSGLLSYATDEGGNMLTFSKAGTCLNSLGANTESNFSDCFGSVKDKDITKRTKLQLLSHDAKADKIITSTDTYSQTTTDIPAGMNLSDPDDLLPTGVNNPMPRSQTLYLGANSQDYFEVNFDTPYEFKTSDIQTAISSIEDNAKYIYTNMSSGLKNLIPKGYYIKQDASQGIYLLDNPSFNVTNNGAYSAKVCGTYQYYDDTTNQLANATEQCSDTLNEGEDYTINMPSSAVSITVTYFSLHGTSFSQVYEAVTPVQQKVTYIMDGTVNAETVERSYKVGDDIRLPINVKAVSSGTDLPFLAIECEYGDPCPTQTISTGDVEYQTYTYDNTGWSDWQTIEDDNASKKTVAKKNLGKREGLGQKDTRKNKDNDGDLPDGLWTGVYLPWNTYLVNVRLTDQSGATGQISLNAHDAIFLSNGPISYDNSSSITKTTTDTYSSTDGGDNSGSLYWDDITKDYDAKPEPFTGHINNFSARNISDFAAVYNVNYQLRDANSGQWSNSQANGKMVSAPNGADAVAIFFSQNDDQLGLKLGIMNPEDNSVSKLTGVNSETGSVIVGSTATDAKSIANFVADTDLNNISDAILGNIAYSGTFSFSGTTGQDFYNMTAAKSGDIDWFTNRTSNSFNNPSQIVRPLNGDSDTNSGVSLINFTQTPLYANSGEGGFPLHQYSTTVPSYDVRKRYTDTTDEKDTFNLKDLYYLGADKGNVHIGNNPNDNVEPYIGHLDATLTQVGLNYTDDLSNAYSIYYRVYQATSSDINAQRVWSSWRHDGALAGNQVGLIYAIEAKTVCNYGTFSPIAKIKSATWLNAGLYMGYAEVQVLNQSATGTGNNWTSYQMGQSSSINQSSYVDLSTVPNIKSGDIIRLGVNITGGSSMDETHTWSEPFQFDPDVDNEFAYLTTGSAWSSGKDDFQALAYGTHEDVQNTIGKVQKETFVSLVCWAVMGVIMFAGLLIGGLASMVFTSAMGAIMTGVFVAAVSTIGFFLMTYWQDTQMNVIEKNLSTTTNIQSGFDWASGLYQLSAFALVNGGGYSETPTIHWMTPCDNYNDDYSCKDTRTDYTIKGFGSLNMSEHSEYLSVNSKDGDNAPDYTIDPNDIANYDSNNTCDKSKTTCGMPDRAEVWLEVKVAVSKNKHASQHFEYQHNSGQKALLVSSGWLGNTPNVGEKFQLADYGSSVSVQNNTLIYEAQAKANLWDSIVQDVINTAFIVGDVVSMIKTIRAKYIRVFEKVTPRSVPMAMTHTTTRNAPNIPRNAMVYGNTQEVNEGLRESFRGENAAELTRLATETYGDPNTAIIDFDPCFAIVKRQTDPNGLFNARIEELRADFIRDNPGATADQIKDYLANHPEVRFYNSRIASAVVTNAKPETVYASIKYDQAQRSLLGGNGTLAEALNLKAGDKIETTGIGAARLDPDIAFNGNLVDNSRNYYTEYTRNFYDNDAGERTINGVNAQVWVSIDLPPDSPVLFGTTALADGDLGTRGFDATQVDNTYFTSMSSENIAKLGNGTPFTFEERYGQSTNFNPAAVLLPFGSKLEVLETETTTMSIVNGAGTTVTVPVVKIRLKLLPAAEAETAAIRQPLDITVTRPENVLFPPQPGEQVNELDQMITYIQKNQYDVNIIYTTALRAIDADAEIVYNTIMDKYRPHPSLTDIPASMSEYNANIILSITDQYYHQLTTTDASGAHLSDPIGNKDNQQALANEITTVYQNQSITDYDVGYAYLLQEYYDTLLYTSTDEYSELYGMDIHDIVLSNFTGKDLSPDNALAAVKNAIAQINALRPAYAENVYVTSSNNNSKDTSDKNSDGIVQIQNFAETDTYYGAVSGNGLSGIVTDNTTDSITDINTLLQQKNLYAIINNTTYQAMGYTAPIYKQIYITSSATDNIYNLIKLDTANDQLTIPDKDTTYIRNITYATNAPDLNLLNFVVKGDDTTGTLGLNSLLSDIDSNSGLMSGIGILLNKPWFNDSDPSSSDLTQSLTTTDSPAKMD